MRKVTRQANKSPYQSSPTLQLAHERSVLVAVADHDVNTLCALVAFKRVRDVSGTGGATAVRCRCRCRGVVWRFFRRQSTCCLTIACCLAVERVLSAGRTGTLGVLVLLILLVFLPPRHGVAAQQLTYS